MTWTTVYDDSAGTGFLLQMRAESSGWVDIRVFRVVGYPYGGKSYTYGYDDEDATDDLAKAQQFARGSCKNDGGWYLRIEFCDHSEHNAMVEVNAVSLAKVLAAIGEHTPIVAGLVGK